MAENDNLKTLMATLEAFHRNDIEATVQTVADDVVYTVRGRAPVSGTYYGREALAGVLQRIKDLTGGTMMGITEVVLSRGDNVMIYTPIIGKAGGRGVTSPADTLKPRAPAGSEISL